MKKKEIKLKQVLLYCTENCPAMDGMDGAMQDLEEPLPEKLQRIRRIWLHKLMAIIYDTFFHDDAAEEIYQSRNDTALLMTVICLTVIIALLFGLKFHTYMKCRRAILSQIQIVNTKWQSMLVSIDILRKIVEIHSSIVKIDQLKQKQSEYDTEQSSAKLESKSSQDVIGGASLESSIEIQHKSEVLGKERKIRKPMILKKPKYKKNLPKEKNPIHLSKTRKELQPVSNEETDEDDIILPDTRKSKNRYTMQSAKSRSQPNLTLICSGEERVNIDAALAKLSHSEMELKELQSRVCGNKLFDNVSSIAFSQSQEIALSKDTIALTPAINAKYVASTIYGDIEEYSNQIIELLKKLELDGGAVSLDKNVEISSLINILLSRIFDELNNIKEDLAHF